MADKKEIKTESPLKPVSNSIEQLRSSAQGGVIDSYFFKSENIPVNIKILDTNDYVPHYIVTIPGLAEGTKIILNTLKGELVTDVKLDISELIDPKKAEQVKSKFNTKALSLLDKHFPSLTPETKQVLASYLIQNTLGLGDLEIPMHDENLEEVVINSAEDPVWVYHKRFGWLKSNVKIKNEESIYDYAAMIARKVGKQINILNPLLDAHLQTGDRVNATLSPVSSFGNTITIRKFSKNPWTMPLFVNTKCISPKLAGLLWLCIQNELSLIIAGGTASGKTSFLNALAAFIPPNQRIVSIEDTRELTLPSFLHWIPMSTREPNPEGKGEITMLDLMVNALRQRPDRIIVGEVRRQKEAEVMFEAMHTGHSVYATIHADNAEETITRMVNPPINVPPAVLDALAGVIVQFRHRRFGIRRTLEFAEVMKSGELNMLHKWDIKTDKLMEVGKTISIANTLQLYAGMSIKEIEKDVDEKASVIEWMSKNNYIKVDEVGHIVAKYYKEPEKVLEYVKKEKKWAFEYD
ncbi:MAG: type II/IV secretion system ATPase subunit [Candidatus Micrarchaeia archaeon]|jgi:flagellar protein FlaI